jgi:hypothetical protein
LNPLFGFGEFVKYLTYIVLSVDFCVGGLSVQNVSISGEFSVPPSRSSTPANVQLKGTHFQSFKLF